MLWMEGLTELSREKIKYSEIEYEVIETHDKEENKREVWIFNGEILVTNSTRVSEILEVYRHFKAIKNSAQ